LKFNPFTFGDKTFQLDHLESFTLLIAPDANPKTRVLSILVNFTSHCFTESYGELGAMAYRHKGELRSFSEERHGLSLQLPKIIKGIAERKVLFSRETNYLIAEAVDLSGKAVQYCVFFDIKTARDTEHDLVMTIESAYVKNALPKHLDKIRFRILVGKVARGEKVRSPHHFQK
jgi:hypothetical protein